MKEAYVTPEVEIIRFVTTDVITDSLPEEILPDEDLD